MPTFWLNPTDLIANDPNLRISYPSDHGGGVVTATTVGDFWVSLGVLLPFPAQIDSLVVCYQIAGAPTPASDIRQTLLRSLTSPGSEAMLFDDPTVLASATPVYQARTVGRKAPDAALELSLRLHFGIREIGSCSAAWAFRSPGFAPTTARSASLVTSSPAC